MRNVDCILCGRKAILKETKTDHLVIRCDYCGFLGFANRRESERILLSKLGLESDFW